jgi:hypothetical protein
VSLSAQVVTGYVFNYWELDGSPQGSGVNPITAVMNTPHTAKANYTAVSPLPPISVSISPPVSSIYTGQSVPFTSTASGGSGSYSYQWYVNGDPVPGGTSSSWTFTPTTTGVYYVYLIVYDSLGGAAQSAAAKVTVVSPAVGGYSVSLATHTSALSIAAYIAIVVFFGGMISLKKRKRK